MEALKAQAVASRTYALYKKKDNNPVYDLTCTTSNQVYLDDEALRDKWKDKYEIYNKRIIDAVSGTKGEVMVYNGELIEALYFSMSSGKTQDVQSVFKEDLDYLKSTDSIYDNDSVRGFKNTVYIEEDKFKKLVGINCGEVTVNRIDYNESGYVSSITICDKVFEGNEMRKLLSLRSANFKIDVSNQIEITTYGYGHGVGMSQYGANGYAKNGYNYEKILKHYYNGVEIKNIKDV